VFGELGALPNIREENVAELLMVFEFFRFMLLVRCKTLIYCGQLCNNAVSYPFKYPFERQEVLAWKEPQNEKS
jgi:hypothetical protein